jgi:hypothetical protein
MRARKTPFVVAEFAPLILLALLAGPITWDHYASWAILSLMLVTDPRIWQSLEQDHNRRTWLTLSAFGALLLMLPTVYFSPQAIADAWLLRLATGTKTLALLLWLAAALALVLGPMRRIKAAGISELKQI